MAETKDVAQPTKVITGKARFSYLHVFEPVAMEEGGEKKYSVALLIPKSDKATIAKIEAGIKAAAEAGKAKYGTKWVPKKQDPSPLHDGDIDKPDDEVYAGHCYVSAKAKTKPGIVDKDLNPIMSQDEVYSGCYGRASISFYPYEKGKGGVACGLNNLQKLEDGEALGGRSTAEADFAGFANEDDDFLS